MLGSHLGGFACATAAGAGTVGAVGASVTGIPNSGDAHQRSCISETPATATGSFKWEPHNDS